MNLHQFYMEVWTLKRTNPSWRIGQCLFNHLAEVRPDISEQIRGTHNDPFHAEKCDEPKYDRAIKFIEENWRPE